MTGLVLQGADRTTTVLEGGGGTATGLEANDGTTRVADLTLHGFGIALHVALADADVTVDDVAISAPAYHGIEFVGTGHLSVLDSLVASAGMNGIDLSQAASDLQVEVTGTTVQDAGGYAIYAADVSRLTLTDSELTGSGGDGLRLQASRATLTDTALTGNDAGAVATYGSELALIGGSASGNAVGQLVDLGTNDDRGYNDLHDNGGTNLVDDRASGAAAVIHASGTLVGGGAALGIKTGVASALPYWQITGAGNQIDFGIAP